MSEIREHLQYMIDSGLSGAFIYIEEVDGHSQFFTSGYADLAQRRRMKPDSRYRVGSMTKSFTAVITLQLIAEGRLNFEDNLTHHLPDLRIANAERITLEHLLRMRSGLSDFEDSPVLRNNLEAHLRPYSLQEAVQLGIDQPAHFLPGTRYEYCNTNFCLLEIIIERVTGRPLGENLAERIFTPLSLSNTSYPDVNDLTLPEPYIRGYEWTEDGWLDCSHIFFGRGDGAIISTALDQARFFRALFSGDLLPKASLELMMTLTSDEPSTQKEWEYGMGLIAYPTPKGMIWGHSGGGHGYRNHPYLDLTTGRFVICMLNGTCFQAEAEQHPPTLIWQFSTEIRHRLFSS